MMGVVTSGVAALIFVEGHGGHDRAGAAEKGEVAKKQAWKKLKRASNEGG